MSQLRALGCSAVLVTLMACFHAPVVPANKVLISPEALDRSHTLLLGPIQLTKGTHYAYQMQPSEEGWFDIGIFFTPKAGQPWFPDGVFPTDCQIELLVMKDRRVLFTRTEALEKWMQIPWGPNLNNRALLLITGDFGSYVENSRPSVSYEQGTLTVSKGYDYLTGIRKEHFGSRILAKIGHTYTLELGILSNDARVASLNASLGIQFWPTKHTP